MRSLCNATILAAVVPLLTEDRLQLQAVVSSAQRLLLPLLLELRVSMVALVRVTPSYGLAFDLAP
jgi:hypothetical protein